MNRRLCSSLVAAGIAVSIASFALAQDKNDAPPGMTEADMKAYMEAATPGPKHAFLTEAAGTWSGKCTMWMEPGAEPVKSECTSTIKPIMDGRFTFCELSGEFPEMGPYKGIGIHGFDNVAQTYQATWLDNWGTGIANGTGELSADGKTITWKITYYCPITKKPTTLREVERRTGKDSMTLESFTIDPKTGKEFKMMEIAFSRTSAVAPEKGVGSR